MGRCLPSGTVTFLFTDIERSTELLREIGPERYANALGEHRHVLRQAFKRNGGVEVEQDPRRDALLFSHKAQEDVLCADVVVLQRAGFVLGEDDDLSRSLGEALEDASA